MASTLVDLWPVDIRGILETKPPLTILKEQASILGSKTNNILEGVVSTDGTAEGEFRHKFYIMAPALSGYRYLLFVATHGIEQYPIRLDAGMVSPLESQTSAEKIKAARNFSIAEAFARESQGDGLCHSEDEFKEKLREIFGHEKTLKIVQSLLQQSTA